MDNLPDEVVLQIYLYKHNLLYKDVMNELYWLVDSVKQNRYWLVEQPYITFEWMKRKNPKVMLNVL